MSNKEETLTTARESVDPINEVQRELDRAQQGEAGTPSTVEATLTRTDFESFRQELMGQMQQVVKEARGLQSRVDQDRQQWLKEREAQSAEGRLARLEAGVENLDPAVQPYAQMQLEAERQRIAGIRQPAPGAVGAAQSEEEQLRQLVRNYGLSPDDPLVDYASLRQPGLDINERQQRFFQSLQRAQVAKATVVAPAVPAVPAPASRVVTPPSNAAPPAQAGFQSPADLQDALIRGTITVDQYRQTARSRGWPA